MASQYTACSLKRGSQHSKLEVGLHTDLQIFRCGSNRSTVVFRFPGGNKFAHGAHRRLFTHVVPFRIRKTSNNATAIDRSSLRSRCFCGILREGSCTSALTQVSGTSNSEGRSLVSALFVGLQTRSGIRHRLSPVSIARNSWLL